MRIDQIKLDLKARDEGDWVGGLPNIGDMELKVRGQGYPPYEEELAAKRRAAQLAAGALGKPLDPETDGALIADAMVRHCLLDWRGLVEADGVTPMPFDQAVAFELVRSPEGALFKWALITATAMVANRRLSDREVAEKNS